MGAGLRPNAKALEMPPNPTVRCAVFYPTANKAGRTMLRVVPEVVASVEGRGPSNGNATRTLLAPDTEPRSRRTKHNCEREARLPNSGKAIGGCRFGGRYFEETTYGDRAGLDPGPPRETDLPGPWREIITLETYGYLE